MKRWRRLYTASYWCRLNAEGDISVIINGVIWNFTYGLNTLTRML